MKKDGASKGGGKRTSSFPPKDRPIKKPKGGDTGSAGTNKEGGQK